MRERNRHRFDVITDCICWFLAGVLAVSFVHFQAGLLWLDIAVGLLFFLSCCLIFFSPSYRRYIRKQFIGAQRFSEERVVGKYNILEDDLEKIREACLRELSLKRPSLSVHEWQGRKWEAVKDCNKGDLVFVLIPGLFTDTEIIKQDAVVAVEGCVITFWNGNTWLPTDIFLVGNEMEAGPILKTYMHRMRYLDWRDHDLS